MIFFPYRRLEIKTQLNSDEVSKKIGELLNVESYSYFAVSGKRIFIPPFNGWLEYGKFKIWRNIRYKNAFRPTVIGIIQDNGSGITLKLKFRVKPIAGIFMAVWFIAAFFLITLNISSSDYNNLWVTMFFFLVYLIMILGFNYEFKVAKNKLIEILNAHEIYFL